MRILVIEDETKTAKFLKKGLGEAGFVVDVAEDGVDGLHLAQEMEFDLVDNRHLRRPSLAVRQSGQTAAGVRRHTLRRCGSSRVTGIDQNALRVYVVFGDRQPHRGIVSHVHCPV